MRMARAGCGAIAALALLLCWAPAAGQAASFDCKMRGLSRTQIAICEDAQLSRIDEQLARRLNGVARRLAFGQYLGVRVWYGAWRQDREQCGIDRACLAASYRAQASFIDRLQQCLESSLQRRTCLRTTLTGREALQR